MQALRIIAALTALTLVPVISRAADPQLAEPMPKFQGTQLMMSPDALEGWKRNRESLRTKGYVDREDSVPNVESVLSKIRTGKDEQGREIRAQRAERVADFDPRKLRFSVGKVPHGFTTPRSENFIILSPHRVMRVMTDTKLGPVLLQEQKGQLINESGLSDDTIAGYPVHITRIRYAGGKFATAVVAGDGTRIVHLEVLRDTRAPAARAELMEVMASLLTREETF